MKVTVLKTFSCAADANGTSAVTHEVGSDVDIADDLVAGLEKEGFVEPFKRAASAMSVQDADLIEISKPYRAKK